MLGELLVLMVTGGCAWLVVRSLVAKPGGAVGAGMQAPVSTTQMNLTGLRSPTDLISPPSLGLTEDRYV